MLSTENTRLSSATEIDRKSIVNMSFVPTKEERHHLYQQSLIAEQDMENKHRSINLSIYQNYIKFLVNAGCVQKHLIQMIRF